MVVASWSTAAERILSNKLNGKEENCPEDWKAAQSQWSRHSQRARGRTHECRDRVVEQIRQAVTANAVRRMLELGLKSNPRS